jgi:hypothetical protein
MTASKGPYVEMRKTGMVSPERPNLQSFLVGQSGLGLTQNRFGSENVSTVLYRLGSAMAARTEPPAPCDAPTAATSVMSRWW